MFFSGDSTTRKRVDLGGRSSKERDRQKLLEQTRLERNRRLYVKKQNQAAIKIQVRATNFVAHALANNTLVSAEDYVWIEEFPPYVRRFLISDAPGCI
ncbi:hypothetical protein Q3G72_010151 [Acer saccharum]|nr:hypothetical protein Q3G72_010151 [Acer saccharum]